MLTAVLLLAIAAVAQAQYPGGGMGGRPGMGVPPSGRPGLDATRATPSTGARTDPVAALAQDLASLEAELGLAAAQLPAWNRHAEQLRRLADDVSRSRATFGPSGDGAPRQFDLITAAAANRLAALEDVAESGKAFYALLGPAQREIADRRLARLALPLLMGASNAPAADAAGGAARSGARPPGRSDDEPRAAQR